jgi:GNAT superfamily N-acetyltransferase
VNVVPGGTSGQVRIRQATAADVRTIVDVLTEAAVWVEQLDGTSMWVENELAAAHVAAEIGQEQFFVAECGGEVAGVIRFQLRDQLFWPDLDTDDSVFVHRIAVRRRYAKHGVSTALLRWAVDRARLIGKQYLRLDCDAERTRLRAFYERFGFELHSYRQVGSYYVARYQVRL